MKSVPPVLFAVAFLLPLPASAQIMKCVGPKGIEFAARCPPGTKAMDTGINNKPAAASVAPQKSLAEREADFKKRKIEQAEKSKKSAEESQLAADRKQNCDSSRAYMQTLENGERIIQRDPKTGERIFLDDAGRATEIARAKRAIEVNCQ